ncbi:hypothetical protein VTL71DRAFT_12035 [Oculimacula yallundae]|uniref:Antifreeze protein n=1 Tax=Oculimacula yallundae TaxID=86028 RepID=A0ABR4CSZ0_9HELO
MQFPTFVTGSIALLMASSVTAHPSQNEARAVTYSTSSYNSQCYVGSPVYCGGNINGICTKGKTSSIDDVAKKANIAACAGKKPIDGSKLLKDNVINASKINRKAIIVPIIALMADVLRLRQRPINVNSTIHNNKQLVKSQSRSNWLLDAINFLAKPSRQTL